MIQDPNQVNQDIEQPQTLSEEELEEVVGGTTYMDGSEPEDTLMGGQEIVF